MYCTGFVVPFFAGQLLGGEICLPSFISGTVGAAAAAAGVPVCHGGPAAMIQLLLGSTVAGAGALAMAAASVPKANSGEEQEEEEKEAKKKQ